MLEKYYLVSLLEILASILVLFIIFFPSAWMPVFNFVFSVRNFISLDNYFLLASYLGISIVCASVIFFFIRVYQKSQNQYNLPISQLFKKTLYSTFFMMLFLLGFSVLAYPQAYSPLTNALSNVIYQFYGSNTGDQQSLLSIATNAFNQTKNNLVKEISQTNNNLTASVTQVKENLTASIEGNQVDIEKKFSADGGTIDGSIKVKGETQTEDIIPQSDTTYDLGSTSKGWDNAYIHRLFGASPITVGSGNSSHSLSDNDDFIVSGNLEVNGTTYLDGEVNLGGVLAVSGALTASSTSSTHTIGNLSVLSGAITGITSINTTISSAELGYVDGVTSAIQTQLDSKLATAGGTMTGNLDISRINARNSDGLKLYDDGGNGIFVENGGNVGIGNTNPSVALDVSGSFSVSGTATIATISVTQGGNIVSADGADGTSAYDENGDLVLSAPGTANSINITTGDGGVGVAPDGNQSYGNNSGDGGDFTVTLGNGGASPGCDIMYFEYYCGQAGRAGNITMNPGSGGKVLLSSVNGKVGIGSTNAEYMLDVRTDVASNYAGYFFNDGNNANRNGLLIQAGLDDHTAAGPSTLVGFRDGDGGVVGSITFASSATAYNTTSDKNLKDFVGETNLTIADLMKIEINDFTWKADPNKKIAHGVFAQDLYSVYPDAVTVPLEESGVWMVDYSKLNPLIIKSIQDQQAQISGITNNQETITKDVATLNLKTDKNITTVAGLQASIDEQFLLISGSINEQAEKNNDQDDEISDLKSRIADFEAYKTTIANNGADIIELKTLTEQLREQINTINGIVGGTLIASMDAKYETLLEIINTDEAGNVNIFKNLTVIGGSLAADGVTTGQITIKNADKKTIGEAMICEAGKKWDDDAEECETDLDGDGKSAEVETNAITENSKVFVTPIGDEPVNWIVKVSEDKTKFSIILDNLMKAGKYVKFNWWIVESR